jgi:hypothetical protein
VRGAVEIRSLLFFVASRLAAICRRSQPEAAPVGGGSNSASEDPNNGGGAVGDVRARPPRAGEAGSSGAAVAYRTEAAVRAAFEVASFAASDEPLAERLRGVAAAFVPLALWMRPRNEFKRLVMWHLAHAHAVVLYAERDELPAHPLREWWRAAAPARAHSE